MAAMLVALPRAAALTLAWPTSPPVPVRARPARRSPGAVTGVNGHANGAAYPELREILQAIPNAGAQALSYDDWRNVVFAIHHETGGSDEGLQLAHEVSARAVDKYDPGFLDERVWPYVKSDRGAVVGLGTLKRVAGAAGWHEPLDSDAFDVVEDERPPLPPALQGDALVGEVAQDSTLAAGMSLSARVAHERDVSTAVPPVLRRGIPEAHGLMTDQANANRLVNAFGRQVFVAAGRWYVWDGRRWAADEADVYRYGCRLSELIREEARAVRARASTLPDPAAIKKAADVAEALQKWALKSEMKGTIEAAIGLARKMLTIDEGLLDRDPWALNCLNGTVDCRTGVLRAHRPEDFITRLVGVRYVPEARCDTWLRVLSQITREDGLAEEGRVVTRFLQRWFGYCLTAMVVEQVFVVHWGGGGNGKSTVLGLMADTMGDYANTAAPGLLAASRGERHPTEIASLMGRRMVTAHESGEGVVLREDFIKQATGEDTLTARYMRGDFFDFKPTHKLQLLTNHKPQVKGQDEGIWRRVVLVPYLAAFGTEEEVREGVCTHVRDRGVLAALREELEGILAWRVRGAIEWAQEGLRPPEAVRVASEGYKQEQDRVGQFVKECCELGTGEGFEAPLTDGMMGGLYPSYVSWAKEGGIFPLSKQRFADDMLRVTRGDKLVDRHISAGNGKRKKLMMVRGVRLLTD